jgi:hypothetical protein
MEVPKTIAHKINCVTSNTVPKTLMNYGLVEKRA